MNRAPDPAPSPLLAALVAWALLWSCSPIVLPTGVVDPYADLKRLPPDTGALTTEVPKGSNAATYGYCLYRPAGDPAGTARYPLLVYLHGDGASETSSGSQPLSVVLGQGPGWVMANKHRNPLFPMIVVSPQNHDDSGWNNAELDAFLRFLIATYPVNPARVYLAGTSHGAYGVYSYLASQGTSSPIAAAVPVAGNGSPSSAAKISCPVWAFHGGKDTTVSPVGDEAMVAAIKAGHPSLDSKITLFANLGHEWNAWYYAFDRPGWQNEPVADGRTLIDPSHAPYDRDIYSWMLQFSHP